MGSKYVDMTSVVQVIGCVYNNPSLLELTDRYIVTDEDFTDDFHRVVFGAIYKIHELGAKTITLENINDFLSSRPKSEAIYKNQDGDKWLMRVADSAQNLSFDYYYNQLKFVLYYIVYSII
jgi:replicative DNA helicase